MTDRNRRKHERLDVTETTLALDPAGHEIGRVLQASGGGITVEASSEALAGKFEIG